MRRYCALLLIVGACAPEARVENSQPSAERLEVAPEEAVLEVGHDLKLEIHTPEAKEDRVHHQTEVRWHSSRPSVASVSGDGRVSALAPGETEIWVEAEGSRGSSRVRVVEPDARLHQSDDSDSEIGERADVQAAPPLRAGDLGPAERARETRNLPPGFVELTRSGWESLHTDGWRPVWNDRALMSIVTDSTAPVACCTVLEHRYPAGFEGGRGPASADFTFARSRHVFISTWWKASGDWQAHSSGVDKLLFVFPASAQGNWYLGWYFKGALRVAPQQPGGWRWLESNVDDSPLRAGVWHRLEWLLEHEDGAYWTVHWWVNGTLRGSHSGVRWTDADLVTVKLNPTWGGTGDRKVQEDFFRWSGTSVSVSGPR